MLCCPEDPAEASRKGGKSPEGETKPPACHSIGPSPFLRHCPLLVTIFCKHTEEILDCWILIKPSSNNPLHRWLLKCPWEATRGGVTLDQQQEQTEKHEKKNNNNKKTTCQPSLSFLHPYQTSHSCLHYEICQRQKESVLQTPGCVNYPRCNQHLTEWFMFVLQRSSKKYQINKNTKILEVYSSWQSTRISLTLLKCSATSHCIAKSACALWYSGHHEILLFQYPVMCFELLRF